MVDGPFNEAKEVIGGFSVIDVADMDAAIALAKTWPHLELPGRRRRDPADGRGLQPVRVTPVPSDAPDGLLARTLREESGPLVARLARQFRDFDLAEEAVQTAVAEALDGVAARRAAGQPGAPGCRPRPGTTPRPGPPPQPAGRARVGRPAEPTTSTRRRTTAGTDDRLALLFACCHPALAPEARLALTLRAVVGLTTPQIARAFLVNERTLAQRIVRAKRKIVDGRHRAHRAAADDVLDRAARRRAGGGLR